MEMNRTKSKDRSIRKSNWLSRTIVGVQLVAFLIFILTILFTIALPKQPVASGASSSGLSSKVQRSKGTTEGLNQEDWEKIKAAIERDQYRINPKARNG